VFSRGKKLSGGFRVFQALEEAEKANPVFVVGIVPTVLYSSNAANDLFSPSGNVKSTLGILIERISLL
jgi:hypothetical protein